MSCDRSPAFIKGVREALPSADITFDKFHIVKIINEAVDKIRWEEAKTNPLLKGAGCTLLKNENNLTAKQKTLRENLSLPGLNLNSVRGLQIREAFQPLYTATTREDFEAGSRVFLGNTQPPGANDQSSEDHQTTLGWRYSMEGQSDQ